MGARVSECTSIVDISPCGGGVKTQDEAGCSKKRRVEHATCLKWKRDLDREHQTFIAVEMRLRGGKWEEGSFQATLQGLYAIRREDKKQEEF